MGTLIGTAIGIPFQLGAVLNPIEYTNYLLRVAADGGLVASEKDALQIIRTYKNAGLLGGIKILESPLLGYKTRTAGALRYTSKLYSQDSTPNDLLQATTTAQPLLSSIQGCKPSIDFAIDVNINHFIAAAAAVTFANGEKWSATYIFNWAGTTETSAFLATDSWVSNSLIQLKSTSVYAFKINNQDGTAIYTSDSTKEFLGKNIVLQFVHNGTTLTVYSNGTIHAIWTIASGWKFSKLSIDYAAKFTGSHYGFILHDFELTDSQLLSEYNLWKELVVDTATVNIGGVLFANRNLCLINSSTGVIIPNGNYYDVWNDGLSCWAYDPTLLEVGGLVYNKASRDIIKANPPIGYHVATEAELTALAALGGNALKVTGTDYWKTTGGTNTSGFSAIAITPRNAAGTWAEGKLTATFWCADSDKALKLYHNSDVAEIVATGANEAHAIRLVKDYG